VQAWALRSRELAPSRQEQLLAAPPALVLERDRRTPPSWPIPYGLLVSKTIAR
jgi:hypothetical protein